MLVTIVVTARLIILNAPKEKIHDAAVKTLNEVLLPAMKEVGDKFGAGELILPFGTQISGMYESCSI